MEMSNCPNFEMSLLDLSQKEHCCLMLILWLLLLSTHEIDFGHDGKMVPN